MTLEEKVLVHRLFVMQRAEELQSVTEACRQLGLSRTLFYRWRGRYVQYGADGLRSRVSASRPHPGRGLPCDSLSP